MSTKLLQVLIVCYSLFIAQLPAMASSAKRGAKQFALGTPSEFVFQSFPGQKLINVKLLGAVKKAGLYHIPPGMDITTLFSLAGGTTSDANLEKVIISNQSSDPTIKTKNTGKVINFEEELKEGRAGQYKLAADDVILVKRAKPLISGSTWRVFSIVSVSLTSLLTVLAIDDRL
jgi:NADH:ubiquinone oxidoreductase subunit F (NADH-binding)